MAGQRRGRGVRRAPTALEKAKKREPVDALIDELVKMRRKAKTKVAKKKASKKSKKARAKR